MEPVVRIVLGKEIRRQVVAHQQAVQPEEEVGDASVDEEIPPVPVRPRHREAGDAEQEVDGVVQHRHLEDAEQFGFRARPGKGKGIEIGGDARNESQDSKQQENGAGGKGGLCRPVLASVARVLTAITCTPLKPGTT